ncbi:hypothetical protein [Quisquiliibacterium transsilvanicum]|uniref:Uncharacterized protein n=1 Tax=Quisquiliibacterium transsilvanicum TaxID=1549638 RepID=A0A7W8MAA5_9BURK|nr:hypothetical protein [Quisquiliibacterium transsilvanicum]MBB5273733.1 hypothetical protein [Quisquiliibacterium transsilvanicum]
MATNFSYRKRQLELEKKRKKEDKLKRKQDRASGIGPDDAGEQPLEGEAADQPGDSAEGGAAEGQGADGGQSATDTGRSGQ